MCESACMNNELAEGHNALCKLSMITAPYRYYTSPPHTSYCCVWCRYTISAVYHESKVLGSHPREQFEAQFDIVTPLPTHSDNIKSVFCILHLRLKFIRMHRLKYICMYIKHTYMWRMQKVADIVSLLTSYNSPPPPPPPPLSYYQVSTHSHYNPLPFPSHQLLL